MTPELMAPIEAATFVAASTTTEIEPEEEFELPDANDAHLDAFFTEENKVEYEAKKQKEALSLLVTGTEEDSNQLANQELATAPSSADFLLTLRDDATESIQTITSKVTADTFTAGMSLTAGIFSTLGSIIGSCGLVCAHMGALASAGSSSLGASAGFGGLGLGGSGFGNAGFSIDKYGNFHLSGSADSLSKATGIAKSDLLAGKFSVESLLASLTTMLGDGISHVFGFGLVAFLIDQLIPTPFTTPSPIAQTG